jgi:hypothetical protein
VSLILLIVFFKYVNAPIDANENPSYKLSKIGLSDKFFRISAGRIQMVRTAEFLADKGKPD